MVEQVATLEQPAAGGVDGRSLARHKGGRDRYESARLRSGKDDPAGGEGNGRLDHALPGQSSPPPVDLTGASGHARYGHRRTADHVVHRDVAERHLDRHHRVGLHVVVDARHGTEEVETG